MFNYKILFVIIFCISNCSLVSAVERVDPLKVFLKEFETLQADFTQTLLSEDGEELEKTTGTLYLQQPGKFNWHYKKPYVQKIITNGEVLWIYDEDLEQLTIRKFQSDMIEKTPAAIILGNSRLEQHFVQVDLGDIEGFNWVELTPRDLEAQYKNIRIGFDLKRLGMMIIADNLGQTTRIDFDDVNKNTKLSPELFNFEIPDGVDVIDERLINNN
ncbi:MAG: outer-membrane lipoprotein carrier protein [marine bacterium B5-7]|nr:MAG: outer-membrane lipoprotein carrier protein [marine bacterium B5-7]